MNPMHDMYWFLDSVPTKDLGLTEKGIKNGEDYHVIGGMAGDLPSIIEAYDNLRLNRTSKGNKFVKNLDNLLLADAVLTNLIDSRRILVLGTVFYHSQIPKIFQQNPDLFVSPDNREEKGINGMRGRSFAQTVWIFMELVKNNPDINPIVCLDNEDEVIQQSVKFHFKGQLKRLKPKAKVKVQSVDKAREDEPKGYIVSDIICSLLGEYVKSPNRYIFLEDLIAKTIKFDSKLEQVLGTNLGVFKTELVQQWTLGVK